MSKLNIGAVKKSIADQSADVFNRVRLSALKGDKRDIAREFHMLNDMRKPRRTSKSSPQYNPSKDYCQNVMPYPESMAETLDRDYINASVIDGIVDRKYIAAQGPLDSTIEDFWSMVVKSRAKQIVALCSDAECATYLPRTDAPLTFHGGAVRVRSLGVEAVDSADDVWCLTRLEVIYGEETLKVERIQCSNWADSGILPAATLLSLAEHVNAAGKDTTTLVHCRAGAGRTGCLLAVCSLLADIEKQSRQALGETPCVSVARTVIDLRSFRPHMVQTLEQYQAIYDAMAECDGRRSAKQQQHTSNRGDDCCQPLAGLGDACSLREC